MVSFSRVGLILLSITGGCIDVAAFTPSIGNNRVTKMPSQTSFTKAPKKFSPTIVVTNNCPSSSEPREKHQTVAFTRPKKFTKTIASGSSTSLNLNSSGATETESSAGVSLFSDISLPYAAAWIGFLGYGLFFSPGGLSGNAESTEILNKIIANPLHSGVNEIFMFIFSLFTFIPYTLAALLMPAAKDQKLPATPFLIASSFVGYGALGPYMATRKPVTEQNQTSLGWFTSNVLENKVANWVVVAFALSSIFTTGFFNGVTSDLSGEIEGLKHLLTSTTIANVSTLDLTILTLTAASLIPEDLKRRGVNDDAKATLIALSTLLLPVIGSTFYCALRPDLPEE